jgi:low temperature requirement protein LtrA
VVQLGWIAVLLIPADVPTTFLMIAPLYVLELATPYVAERNATTPWHAHHIAERYGLLAIIALGECLIGAVETLRAIVASHGWSVDAALVGFGGTALAFGMWWIYFILPAGRALHLQRQRSYLFGYGHIPVFAAIAATGAGLHVAAYFIDHAAHISAAVAVTSIAVPVAIFKVSLTALFSLMTCVDRTLVAVTTGVVVVLAGAVALAAAGVSVPICLLIIVAALGASIVIDERRNTDLLHAALEKLEQQSETV